MLNLCNEDRANHFGMTHCDGALPAGAEPAASELISLAHTMFSEMMPACLSCSCLEVADVIISTNACASSVVGPAAGTAATVPVRVNTR